MSGLSITPVRFTFILFFILSECLFAQNQLWVPLQDTEGRFISDIRTCPSNPDSIYAIADGLLLSTNGGERWDSIAPGVCCGVLGIDPAKPGHIFLNMAGLPFDGNALRLSTDSGQTWTEVMHGTCREQLGCAAPFFVYGAHLGSTIYSSMNPVFILRSIDGGSTWDSLAPPPAHGLWSIAISHQDPSIMYGGFTTPISVLRSADEGATWTTLPFPISNTEGGIYLAVDPRDHDIVYAAVIRFGVFKSLDGGATWLEINEGLPPGVREMHAVTINPHNPDELFLGMEDDSPFDGESDLVYVTTDGGQRWSRLSSGLPSAGHVSTFSIDPHVFRIFAGVNSPEDGWSASGIYELGPAASIASGDPGVRGAGQLLQNSPNPFNAQTTIHFSLDTPSMVKVRVFSLPGELVSLLLEQEMEAGEHSVSFEAKGLSTGVYFYTLETEKLRSVRPMILLR